MKDVLLKLIMKVIEGLITDDVINNAKQEAVNYLRELAKQTDNEVDDRLVEIVARALGVK